MVGVAQLVEHKVVALVAAGSSPVAHPKHSVRSSEWGVRNWDGRTILPHSAFRTPHFIAPVAQLDRASDFESGCRRFEPCRAHTNQLMTYNW